MTGVIIAVGAIIGFVVFVIWLIIVLIDSDTNRAINLREREDSE